MIFNEEVLLTLIKETLQSTVSEGGISGRDQIHDGLHTLYRSAVPRKGR